MFLDDIPRASVAYDRVSSPSEISYTSLGKSQEVQYDQVLATTTGYGDLTMSQAHDRSHAEPTIDPALPSYTTKVDEFEKFQH